MSIDERISTPPPKVTADGKYTCTIDNTTFDNLDDYDQHCMKAHTKAGGARTWQVAPFRFQAEVEPAVACFI